MEDRWSRTRLLIGAEACSLLAEARITVVGLGGVGSFAAEGLADAGGQPNLVDSDRVVSNINRQLIALTSTINQAKVDVVAKRVKDINPECKIESCAIRCNKDTIKHLLRNRPHYVVDAIDSVMDKVVLIQQCLKGTSHHQCYGCWQSLDPTKFEVADISKTIPAH